MLIVTLVNSAVDNFENRIKGFFENPVQALYKYRVRTLHGLAHDIVREKPASVGLENQFSIIDEREADFIRRESVNAWLAAHPDFLDDYLDPALDTSKRDWVKRQQLPNLVDSLALAFIRSSKDRLLTPDSLRLKLDASFAPLPLAELGWSIYADYQRALAYRGAVDFDDLIRLALTLLQNDEEYLERLRFRYPFILEDEAQDSSRTQQQILVYYWWSSSRAIASRIRPLADCWFRYAPRRARGYSARVAAIGCALVTQTKPSLKPSQPRTLTCCVSLFAPIPMRTCPSRGGHSLR